MSLFAELKRRNVFRVGLFYIVAAWVVVQVAETLLPVFEVPDGFIRGIVVLLAIGLVPALIFAWAFELTPDGLKLDREPAEGGSQNQSSNRMNWATLVLALVAIGLLVTDRLIPETILPESVVSTPQSGASDESAGQAEQPTPPLVQPPASRTLDDAGALPFDNSIAVLAFENMSPDPDNAFFAEGISEEILNVLAAIDALRVASRTSSFSLSGRGTPIPEIAARLGVGHVLEGSVRKAGNQVRITAQLIEAATDTHLWSDTFDRELVDIFAIQEEIAQAIADALTDKLGLQSIAASARSIQVEASTDDLEAYELFLRGRRTFYQRGETLEQAIADLQAAVSRDPDFGQAWAVLAAAYLVVRGYSSEMDDDESAAGARRAIERALSLAPNNPLAIAVDAQIQTQFNFDRRAGLTRGE